MPVTHANGIVTPAGPDNYRLTTDLGTMADTTSPMIAASTDRPAHQVGRVIYENDTHRILVSTGTAWRALAGPPKRMTKHDQTLKAVQIGATLAIYTSNIAVIENRVYDCVQEVEVDVSFSWRSTGTAAAWVWPRLNDAPPSYPDTDDQAQGIRIHTHGETGWKHQAAHWRIPVVPGNQKIAIVATVSSGGLALDFLDVSLTHRWL